MGEEAIQKVDDEKLYVAVSKELKACKSTILWALQNSKEKRVCLIHVHQPAQFMSILGGKFPISSLSGSEVRAHRAKERQEMLKLLDDYALICARAGVKAEKLYIEMDTIEKGLVELIEKYKIEKLVMGAAANNRYSRRMTEPKSRKAIYVRQNAPSFCHIWFACKGHLIYTRESDKQLHTNEDDVNDLATHERRLTQSTSGWSTPVTRADSDEFDRSSTFSISLSGYLQFPGADLESASALTQRIVDRESLSGPLSRPPRSPENPPGINALEEKINYVQYDQLDQGVVEVEAAKSEAFEESMKRRKAEIDAIEAIRKAKAAESLYYEEYQRRKEVERDLAKAKEELNRTKKERDKALEELRLALDQKSRLERQVEESDLTGKELEGKIISALELLQNYTKL